MVYGTPKRTRAQTSDPPTGEVGPNSGRIGYMPSGDKVEWVKEVDQAGKLVEWPSLLRRNDNDILKAYSGFWDKVWWNRHQNWLHRIETGLEPLTEEQKPFLDQAKKAARRIERKYGKKNLGWDDFEWGLLSGKTSALSWVMGARWEESLDTRGSSDGVAIVGPTQIGDPDGLRGADVDRRAVGVGVACRQLADPLDLCFGDRAHGHHHRSVEAAGRTAGEAGAAGGEDPRHVLVARWQRGVNGEAAGLRFAEDA